MVSEIHTRDAYLAYHHLKTAMYGDAILSMALKAMPADAAARLPPYFRESLWNGNENHDISKTLENGWIEELLFGSRHPTINEWEYVIFPHPKKAFDILGAAGIKDSVMLNVARYHHKRFDGVFAAGFSEIHDEERGVATARTIPLYAGYGEPCAGGEIPLEARIAKIADAVCAMEENRPYRSRSIPMDEIKRNVEERAGTEYDPALAWAFCDIPISELVEISETRLSPSVIRESALSRMRLVEKAARATSALSSQGSSEQQSQP